MLSSYKWSFTLYKSFWVFFIIFMLNDSFNAEDEITNVCGQEKKFLTL